LGTTRIHESSLELTCTPRIHMTSVIHTSPQRKGKASQRQRKKGKAGVQLFTTFPPSIPPHARPARNETISWLGPSLLHLIRLLLPTFPTDTAPGPFPGRRFGLQKTLVILFGSRSCRWKITLLDFRFCFENSQNCKQSIATHRRIIFHAAESSQMPYNAKIWILRIFIRRLEIPYCST
jgi:hypothetical protein